VLAAALMAVLFAGMQSAVMIASKAIPSRAAATDFPAQGGALDRLALDISYAKTVSLTGSTKIAIVVADRDGDAADDTITYSWSGVASAPLQRQFNSGTAEDILKGVSAFSLSLQTEVVAGADSLVEGSEKLLGSYSSASNTTKYTVDPSAWVSQEIPVSLPAGTVDYRTTRVRMNLSASGAATGSSSIELRSLRAGAPTTRVLASASLDESTLPGGAGWVSIAAPSVRYLEPNESIGLLARATSASASVDVYYVNSGAPAGAGTMETSGNAGGTWTAAAGKAVMYELWGVCRTSGGGTSITRATSARVTVQAGSNAASELSLVLANRPEVTP
jgi:hypothetical protein